MAAGGMLVASRGVQAQAPATLPTIGFLHSGAEAQNVQRLVAFRKGLAEQGFTEGTNCRIDFRWAAGRDEVLAAGAADFAARQVPVVFADTRALPILRRAAPQMPAVFATGGDPVVLGFVPSLNRPGGVVTGATSSNAELAAKRLGLMRELVPAAQRFHAFVNPASSLAAAAESELQAAARELHLDLHVVKASSESQIEAGFASLPSGPGQVLIFPPDSYFYIHRAQITALAARRGLPAIYDVRDYVDAGGLVSYGTDFLDVMRLAGGYVGRVLRGEKPGDLPVQRTARFELVINLKAAKGLGLEIPPRLLSTADDTVE
jgi:putative ABC transport system substrate-binding protein